MEQYVLWKIAISIYTMERPYKLYHLFNALFHCKGTGHPLEKSMHYMQDHLHFLCLLQLALGSWSRCWTAQLRFSWQLCRRVQVGGQEAQRGMVQNSK